MAEIIEMPKLSDTMSVGTLVKWLKQEGDEVATGDMLCEVETDKATMEVENFVDGVMLKHYVAEGGEIPVGAPMCAVGEKGEDAPKVDMPSKKEVEEAKKEDEEEAAPAPKKEEKPEEKKPEPAEEKPQSLSASRAENTPIPAPSPAHPGGTELATEDAQGRRIMASPLAKKIAGELGVPIEKVRGTGPGGRIVRKDVEAAAQRGVGKDEPASTSAPAGAKQTPASFSPIPAGAPIAEDKATPVSNMRGAIARRLLESKTQIPHFYLELEIDAAPLAQVRKAVNEQLADVPPEKGGMKFTVNDYILKACAEALRRVPAVNASWQGDSIQQHGSVHLAFGVAVAEGLVTPVIRDAHAKSLRTIASEARQLMQKARDKKLKPDEMSGSTFTVTNLGMFGITNFYGIINPPNAGILSVGAAIQKPVVNAKGEIVAGQRMNLGFSGDHRVVDGANGAMFLSELKNLLETPAAMLV